MPKKKAPKPLFDSIIVPVDYRVEGSLSLLIEQKTKQFMAELFVEIPEGSPYEIAFLVQSNTSLIACRRVLDKRREHEATKNSEVAK